LTLRSLEAGLYPRAPRANSAALAADVLGLHFPNPLGIAAGFDKDARVFDAVLAMGWGFAEIGTVTPRPQSGNPQPRVFRLGSQKALINRLGFNNQGIAAALARLRSRAGRGVVGVNVGANKDSADRAADYVEGIRRFYDVADYFTINISSPNTPGLRDLQAPAVLDDLLARVLSARQELVAAGKPQRPVVVKLAPDIAEEDLPSIVQVLLARGIDGIAVSNTTVSRPGLNEVLLAKESGGLSGRPLFHMSTVLLARVFRLTEGRVPLIGIGGIDSPSTAIAKIEAGASLLQLYTGLVFEGPGLLTRIMGELSRYAEVRKLARIDAATGRRAEEWASKPLRLD
jgi:dihydroorotate dehydrogenase